MATMKLKTWQKKYRLSDVKMAKLLGCDPSMVSYYHAGDRNFSAAMAKKIQKITKKEVSALEILYRGKI